jgi:aminoglycoside phosphotransferase (APT) family kinase protein
MADRQLPDAATVEAFLAPEFDVVRRTGVRAVRDLSPGLGQAAVLAATLAAPGSADPTRLIVKVPGWGNRSGLDPRDAELEQREVRFLSSEIPGKLPAGLAVPPDTAVVHHDGEAWIVMSDVGPALRRRWTPGAATVAVRRLASLHRAGTVVPGLLETPWLERDGGSAYAHHVPTGHQNLDALAQDARLAELFTAEEVRELHGCLDAAEDIAELARRLAPTLVHGDFHSRNAGMDEDGTLVLIDWEHVGVGPVGYDLATFTSLYRAFGGTGQLDEAAILSTYADAVSDEAGTDLREAAAVGFATVHLTWGLHLRLGPGLTAVREGFHGETPEELAPHLEDIRSGCRRALSWAPLVREHLVRR